MRTGPRIFSPNSLQKATCVPLSLSFSLPLSPSPVKLGQRQVTQTSLTYQSQQRSFEFAHK